MEIKTNMFDAIDIAVSGLRAYGKHMEVIGPTSPMRTTNADGTGSLIGDWTSNSNRTRKASAKSKSGHIRGYEPVRK